MAIPRRNVRNSSGIATMAGRSSQGDEPYRMFMRITCLEMEKARRSKERDSAMFRIESIDERIRAIELEKGVLLDKIRKSNGTGVAVRGAGASPDDGGRPPFRIRY